MNSSLRAALKSAGWLALFAALGSGVLAGTYLSTRDRIVLSEQQKLARQINLLVPASRYDNAITADTLRVTDARLGGTSTVYRARKRGEPVALVLSAVAPDGYSGNIHLLIGVNADGRLAGVRVTGQKETPGLGDKIDLERDEWILGFDGKSLEDPVAKAWAVKKDGGVFDQFAGATITPRAVVAAVRRTLEYVQEHRDALYAPAAENTP